MSPQRWATHSCSWTRQGSTHLFVFRVVDWSCGVKNCLLCVVKYLTDILQRSSRALKKKKTQHSSVNLHLPSIFFFKSVLILRPFSTGHFDSFFGTLFKNFLPLNFLLLLLLLLKFISVFSSDQQRVPRSAKVKTLPPMFHLTSFQPDHHVVLGWLLECTYIWKYVNFKS